MRRCGVTLIEAIAVILLLSAAAASTMIYLDGSFLSRGKAAATTHHVGNALLIARNTAISHQANVHVRRISRSGVEQLQILQEAGPLQDERSWVIDLPSGASVSGSAREVIFAPVGSANVDVSWKVQHGGEAGEVSVSPISGRVTWKAP